MSNPPELRYPERIWHFNDMDTDRWEHWAYRPEQPNSFQQYIHIDTAAPDALIERIAKCNQFYTGLEVDLGGTLLQDILEHFTALREPKA